MYQGVKERNNWYMLSKHKIADESKPNITLETSLEPPSLFVKEQRAVAKIEVHTEDKV